MTELTPADPAVLFLTLALTAAVRRMAPSAQRRRLRHLTPMLACLLAVGIRAALTSVQGDQLSWEVVARGLMSGVGAVWTHAQFRELMKAATEAQPQAEPEDPDLDPSFESTGKADPKEQPSDDWT